VRADITKSMYWTENINRNREIKRKRRANELINEKIYENNVDSNNDTETDNENDMDEITITMKLPVHLKVSIMSYKYLIVMENKIFEIG